MTTDLLNRPVSENHAANSAESERHSVDPSSVSANCNPDLIKCRSALNKLIKSPPTGSLPMLIDWGMAKAMLERNRNNRQISETTVRRYVDELKRNDWKLNGETIKFTRSGVLGDGQHRLEAISRTNISAWTDVRFGLDEDVFDTIDVGKKRTGADILSKKGVPNAALIAGACALLWRYEQPIRMTKVRPTHKQTHETMERHPLIHDIARDARRVCAHLRSEKMSSLTPSICAFVWTLAAEYDKDKAYEFFDQLDRALNISNDRHPAKMLRRYLASNEGPRRVKATTIAAVTIKAWNVAAKGELIKDFSYLRMREAGDAPENFPIAIRRKPPQNS